MTSITQKIQVLIEMIGSSPELGPIMAGTYLLKRRKVDKRFLHLTIRVILQVCLFFSEGIDEDTGGKGVSLDKTSI